MNKQEQVAEMAVIGCVRNPQAHTAEECAKCDFKQGQCNAYRHAEALYDAGYRKVDDVRKETAKEIISAMKTMIVNRRADERSGLNLIYATYSPERLFNDISEYVRITVGVEVEE